ncbi:hypothetical protein EJ04DRAFT_589399 [Polyplosphaeria fusca]|uniref:Uncharacterized protein n=1 Tax=Polyplosphaeria fusca TaxID=682080 RepID=A0A9P4QQZ7_9PLEO|nr:hypothetical protein EJ04DRAFT_589399 [Polyplosphaeria fusca]
MARACTRKQNAAPLPPPVRGREQGNMNPLYIAPKVLGAAASVQRPGTQTPQHLLGRESCFDYRGYYSSAKVMKPLIPRSAGENYLRSTLVPTSLRHWHDRVALPHWPHGPTLTTAPPHFITASGYTLPIVLDTIENNMPFRAQTNLFDVACNEWGCERVSEAYFKAYAHNWKKYRFRDFASQKRTAYWLGQFSTNWHGAEACFVVQLVGVEDEYPKYLEWRTNMYKKNSKWFKMKQRDNEEEGKEEDGDSSDDDWRSAASSLTVCSIRPYRPMPPMLLHSQSAPPFRINRGNAPYSATAPVENFLADVPVPGSIDEMSDYTLAFSSSSPQSPLPCSASSENRPFFPECRQFPKSGPKKLDTRTLLPHPDTFKAFDQEYDQPTLVASVNPFIANAGRGEVRDVEPFRPRLKARLPNGYYYVMHPAFLRMEAFIKEEKEINDMLKQAVEREREQERESRNVQSGTVWQEGDSESSDEDDSPFSTPPSRPRTPLPLPPPHKSKTVKYNDPSLLQRPLRRQPALRPLRPPSPSPTSFYTLPSPSTPQITALDALRKDTIHLTLSQKHRRALAATPKLPAQLKAYGKSHMHTMKRLLSAAVGKNMSLEQAVAFQRALPGRIAAAGWDGLGERGQKRDVNPWEVSLAREALKAVVVEERGEDKGERERRGGWKKWVLRLIGGGRRG